MNGEEKTLEEKILNLLLTRGLMSTSQIARELNVRREIVAGYLRALKDQGKIEIHKVGNAYVYSLKLQKVSR